MSDLSRGHPVVRERALAYLTGFGRLTITAVTVFERLRGYRLAIRDGKPFERQLRAFEVLVANGIVLIKTGRGGPVRLRSGSARLVLA